MVQLPLPQKLLMVYGWISMCLYVILVSCLLRWRRKMPIFRSSYYHLFFLQAIADFYMFLTIELIMRPRKYNFFNLFNENMHAFAVFSYFNLTCAQTVLTCGHILISLNRLTTFYKPLAHKKIWTNKRILLGVLSLWIVAIISAVPFLFVFRNHIGLYLKKDGVVQLFAGELAKLYDITQSVVVSATVLLFCSISYALTFMLARKSMQRNESVERNLLICAAASSFPFCIEFLRAIAQIFSSFNNISALHAFFTEFWYFEREVMSSLSMWLQVIVNKSLRKCLFDELARRRKPSTSSMALKTSVA